MHLGEITSAIDSLDNDESHIDKSNDGVILNTISSSLISLKECLQQRTSTSRIINEASLDHVHARQSYISHNRHKTITASRLAEYFFIIHNTVSATLRATNQRGVRSAILPL